MKKMKDLRSFVACMLVLVLSLGMCLPFLAKTVKAADTTYTVRVFSGERGNFSGKSDSVNEVKEYTGIKYGTYFSFASDASKEDNVEYGPTKEDVTVTDGKYYVRGFKESGRDNNTYTLGKFKVEHDIDYVVAYGVAGSSVEYYVNYVDENGNTLAPTETYYGNVGDKPVVAYLYLDGYFPQARNLTKTLSSNAKENNFTFIYQLIEPPTTATTEETTETTTQATTQTTQTQQQTTQAPAGQTTIIERTVPAATTAAPANPTTPAATTPAATTAAPTDGTTAAADGTDTDADTDTDTLPDNPEDVPDLVDIDDQDTPLADFDGSTTENTEETSGDDLIDEDTPRSGLSTPAKVGIGVGSVAVIAAAAGALYYFLVYRSRKSGEEEDPDDNSDDDDDDFED